MEASNSNPCEIKNPVVEVLDYNDLIQGKDLTSSIENAFGVNGPGLLTVKNIPGLIEAR